MCFLTTVASVPLRRCLLLLLTGSVLGISGCTTATEQSAAEPAIYGRGDLETTVTAEHSAVIVACRAAMQELDLAVDGEAAEALRTIILGHTPEGKRVEIVLTNADHHQTHVKIRVGILGDEEFSVLLLEKIKAGL